MAIDKSIRLPQKFRKQYSRSIALRLAGSLVLLSLSAVLCTVIDFSQTRYPVMGIVMVAACGFVLACMLFRLHAILFQPGWTGTIINISADYHVRPHNRGFSRRFIVTLIIDCGEEKPKKFELLHEDMHGENKYYTYAPYKIGDTVIFLRGLKYPMRYNIATEDMLDIQFVCPCCGEINKAERDTCFKCGKFLVK